jgi:integrase
MMIGLSAKRRSMESNSSKYPFAHEHPTPGIAHFHGAHSLRRTKASLIYRRTKNLRAVQLLLGHTKLGSTVRYLGIEVDDALKMAEQTEI